MMPLVYRAAQPLTRLAFILLFRTRAWGVEHVPRRGGALLVSNHQSFLDPPLVGVAMRRPMRFMARESLFAVPLLGRLIRALGAFPVERGAADLRAVRSGIELLRQGECLLLFPEGTRTHDGHVGAFRPGFAVVASRAGVPVVPVAIEGAFGVWPRHRRLPRLGCLRVAFGELLAPPGRDRSAREEAALEVHRRVAALHEELRHCNDSDATAPPGQRGPASWRPGVGSS